MPIGTKWSKMTEGNFLLSWFTCTQTEKGDGQHRKSSQSDHKFPQKQKAMLPLKERAYFSHIGGLSVQHEERFNSLSK